MDSLALPPEGYYYATVLTRVTDAASTALEFIDLGPQKAPYPRRNVSLYDADINQTLDPAITLFPPSILAASERVQIDTIAGASLSTDQPFRLYREVRVTLEAKQGIDLPSSTVIIAATFPEPSVKPPED